MHHIISSAAGIERRKIYNDDADRDNFLERLGIILKETSTPCYGWALIPNHFHLLLRTGKVPISTVMRRLLTGYAVSSNRRHRRCGHLFQNRFKSILCQEDLYLKELVGYIYLNPLWDEIVAERILGDSDFVKEVLAEQKEQFERRYRLKAHGYDIDRVVQKVAEVLKIEQEEIWKPGNQPLRVNARSLVCYWAVRELGMSGTSVGKLLGLDQPAVSHAVLRGEKLTQVLNLKLNIRNQHLIFKRRPGSRAFPEKKNLIFKTQL